MKPNVVILLLLAPAAMQSQHRADLDARIGALDSTIAAKEAELASAWAGSLRDGEVVLIETGGFRIRSERAIADRVRAASERAWASVERRGGTWLARELPRHPLVVWEGSRTRSFGTSARRFAIAADDSTQPDDGISRVPAESLERGLMLAAQGLVDRSMSVALKSTLHPRTSWSGATYLMTGQEYEYLTTPTDASHPRWSELHRTLRLRPSRSNRRCLDGDVSACAISLGLEAVEGQVDAWYASSDYKWLAPQPDGRQPGTTGRDLRENCAQGDPDSCRAFVLQLPPAAIPAPTPFEARQALLSLALDRGGPGALERLLATEGDGRIALASSAGVPLDTLVADWMARVRQAPARVPQPVSGWVALLICAVALSTLPRRRP